LNTEQEAARQRELHHRWLSALQQIRTCDGFHDFLRPAPFDKLQTASAKGPVVILNASDLGCAALVITPSGVVHVPLPLCTSKNISMLAKMIQTACGAKRGIVAKMQIQALKKAMRDLPDYFRAERYHKPAPAMAADANEIFQGVLEILWTSVVKPVFRSLNLQVWHSSVSPDRSRYLSSHRKRIPLAASGGTPRARFRFSLYMLQAYMTIKALQSRASSIMSFRLTHSR
jgi:hypothetical protein